MRTSEINSQAFGPSTIREAADANRDPILVGTPWRRGYGHWQVSRMRDVRAVLAHPDTTTDDLAFRVFSRFREKHGGVDSIFRLSRQISRAHRTPNDAERMDAITVTKRLLECLPAQDFRSPLAALVSSGETEADAMAMAVQKPIMEWRAAALGINAALGQEIEIDSIDILASLDRTAIPDFIKLEPKAARIMGNLSAMKAGWSAGQKIPLIHLISPAFLAIEPLSKTSGLMLAHLADNPDLQETLRNRAELRPAYLQEVERLLGAVRYVARQIGPAGLDLGDMHLPPHSLVSCDLAAANRDPELWQDPEAFRFDRPRLQTATFSFGSLACTGSQLSRLFLSTLLDAALETVRLAAPFTAKPDDRRFARWSMIRGYESCRLRFAAI